jgi:hypothetical protein
MSVSLVQSTKKRKRLVRFSAYVYPGSTMVALAPKAQEVPCYDPEVSIYPFMTQACAKNYAGV